MTGFPTNRDVLAVFTAKTVRTFAYGYLGILLPVYLADLGLTARGVGAFITLTLIASAVLTWGVRVPAERLGTRAALLALAMLSVVAGALLLAARAPWVVIAAAMLGNVAVGAGETGPFLSVEQVILARAVPAVQRTGVLSAYNLLGYGAAAFGAAIAGAVSSRTLFATFLVAAVIQILAYARLPAAPTARPTAAAAGPGPSTAIIRRLAALFALDSFGGGFVLQSIVAYFLHVRFGLGLDDLGHIFFVAQIVTAASLLLAARFALRFGLLNTMVVSHLVSNVFLIAIAAAPTAWLAVIFLYARQLLSQMDVPTRQAYVMAVVEDHEREAAATTTTLWRTVTQAISPSITGWVMASVALTAPFVIGGALKILYDLLLYWTFKEVKPKDAL